jgi:GNAT superfamily N-acetyltransferase
MKVLFEDMKDVYLDVVYDESKDYYEAYAMKKNLKKPMAFMSFKITFDGYKREIWLYKIETYKKYQHKYIATHLLKFLEKFAKEKRIGYIEGKYFPENKFAEGFYKRNGYSIYQDGYLWFVDKYLDENQEDKSITISQEDLKHHANNDEEKQGDDYCENELTQD